MADYKEVIERFKAVGFSAVEYGDYGLCDPCIIIDTFNSDVRIDYYIKDNEWYWYGFVSGEKRGYISESSVLALLEALERLENEAKNNGDSADNN